MLTYQFINQLQATAKLQSIDSGLVICTECSYKNAKLTHFKVDLDAIEDDLRLLGECESDDYFVKKCCPNCQSTYKITLKTKGFEATKISVRRRKASANK
jgi:hypothetical protein